MYNKIHLYPITALRSNLPDNLWMFQFFEKRDLPYSGAGNTLWLPIIIKFSWKLGHRHKHSFQRYGFDSAENIKKTVDIPNTSKDVRIYLFE